MWCEPFVLQGCVADRELSLGCVDDEQCESNNCSNDHCAPSDFAYIPAGTFCMGAPDGIRECMGLIQPTELGTEARHENLHQVTLSHDFFLQATEVTQQDWVDQFPANNPSYFDECGLTCPVETVTWWESLAYVNALSVSEGWEPCYELESCDPALAGTGMQCLGVVVSDPRASGNPYLCEGYRLPMEAEWEYGYRAGTTTAFYNGGITNILRSPLDENLDAIGWYGGNSGVSYSSDFDCSDYYDGATVCGTHPVAEKLANDWGLFDMAGNVGEMVWDRYESDYSDSEDPVGGATSTLVVRGGNWDYSALYCRAARRSLTDTLAWRLNRVGFRAARTAFPSHCFDDETNEGESAEDCGGDCRGCLFEEACNDDGDCISTICVNNFCRDGSTGDACDTVDDCNEIDDWCSDDGVCATRAEGDSCDADEECPTDLYCASNVDECRDGSTGDDCDNTADCAEVNDHCDAGSCKDRVEGDRCDSHDECPEPASICSTDSICQDGDEGDGCDSHDDCGAAFNCGGGDTCEVDWGLADGCDDDAQCATDQCSNGFCAPAGFAFIPPGTFCMGSPGGGGSAECPDGDAELGRNSNETLHSVTLTGGVYLQQTEVTQAQWLARFAANPSWVTDCGLDCPVQRVNWWEAVAYVNALSEFEGLEPCYALEECDPSEAGTDMECTGVSIAEAAASGNPYYCEGYRLPMEAEWEYAYRAGTDTAFYNGPFTNQGSTPLDENLDAIGWYAGNSGVTGTGADCSGWYSGSTLCAIHPVAAKLPNEWGLFDMSGNVWEWVWDLNTTYTTEAVENPLGADAGSHRIKRGGGWSHWGELARAAQRTAWTPDDTYYHTGFRPARTMFPGHCSDGETNTGETDVDCGGDCRPCLVAAACSTDGECASGNCSNETCATEGFSYIPPGTFCMGSPDGSTECMGETLEAESGRGADETLHEVTLSRGFLMQQTEVTQQQWLDHFPDHIPFEFDECADAGRDCPAETVNWWEAVAYLNARSVSEGLEPCYTLEGCDPADAGTGIDCSGVTVSDPRAGSSPYQCEGYRLPTEAEWEYSYRAGTSTALYNGVLTNTGRDPLDENLDTIGWYGGNSDVSTIYLGLNCSGDYPGATFCGTHPVAEKDENGWGLRDMAGNVWEWVWDQEGAYSATSVQDPLGDTGSRRVRRGGSWTSSALNNRAAARRSDLPSEVDNNIGFRPVRTLFPTHCSDGEIGEGETDVDCGGDCQPCLLAAACSIDGDCGTGHCSNEHCATDGFAYVPAGSFCMGSPDGSTECMGTTAPEEGGRSNSERLHPVTLTRSFLVHETEVTQQQWLDHFEQNPSAKTDCGLDCPVESVNWWEALAYANALSESEGLESCFTLEGCDPSEAGTDLACSEATVSGSGASGDPYRCNGYRLPTEAEWEYAYRAGTTTAFYNGDITDTSVHCFADAALDAIGWYCGNAVSTTHPVSLTNSVDLKQANDWGLFDMAGNVAEWTWDQFEYSYYSSSPEEDPLGGTGTLQTTRGGHWANSAHYCRAAERDPKAPGDRYAYLGFRVVRTLFPSHCYDGETNDGEADVDCGGECAQCGLAAACSDDVDCGSDNCSNDRCAPEGFAYIPPGTFCMGSPDGSTECLGETLPAELGRDTDETLHEVSLTRGFFLQETEVTQGQWVGHFPENNPAEFDECGLSCPVETVNWWEAAAYLNAMSESDGLTPCYALEGCDTALAGTDIHCSGATISDLGASTDPYFCEGYRFPTEAEWEYAYRAGTTTAFYSGTITNDRTTPVDPNLDAIGWYSGNAGVSYEPGAVCQPGYDADQCGTHEVAGKLPNDWGLYDMAGNVYEWVWDAYQEDYYASSPGQDPLGGTGSSWVRRGGSWGTPASQSRAGRRFRMSTRNTGTFTTGFRPSRTVFPPHCSDGVQNESEADLDCGGTCRGCQHGESCASDADCAGYCVNEVCQDGRTGDPCRGDGEDCTGDNYCCDGSTCVDLASDNANCQLCGWACDAGEVCCGSAGCVDTDTHPDNCGDCGNECPEGDSCGGGICQ